MCLKYGLQHQTFSINLKLEVISPKQVDGGFNILTRKTVEQILYSASSLSSLIHRPTQFIAAALDFVEYQQKCSLLRGGDNMLTKCVIAAADRTKTCFEPGEAEGMQIVENVLFIILLQSFQFRMRRTFLGMYLFLLKSDQIFFPSKFFLSK